MLSFLIYFFNKNIAKISDYIYNRRNVKIDIKIQKEYIWKWQIKYKDRTNLKKGNECEWENILGQMELEELLILN